jgi:hypothetical protein
MAAGRGVEVFWTFAPRPARRVLARNGHTDTIASGGTLSRDCQAVTRQSRVGPAGLAADSVVVVAVESVSVGAGDYRAQHVE